MQDQQNIRKSN